MTWIIEYYNQEVQELVSRLPIGIKAAYARLTNLLIEFGINLRMPHSKALGNGLFELRPKGKEGIARIFYCMLVNKRIVILHTFIKKTQGIPPKHLALALRRMKEIKNEQSN